MFDVYKGERMWGSKVAKWKASGICNLGRLGMVFSAK